jgi:membrane protein implicated in regulation of membrane protease activity
MIVEVQSRLGKLILIFSAAAFGVGLYFWIFRGQMTLFLSSAPIAGAAALSVWRKRQSAREGLTGGPDSASNLGP